MRGYLLALLILLSAVRSFGSVIVVPPNLTFTDQTVGTTSPPQVVTLTYTSPDVPPPVLIAYLDYADFHITRGNGDVETSTAMNCTTLSSSVSCSVSVIFQPAVPGQQMGNLAILTGQPFFPSTQTIAMVTLTGNGVSPFPAVLPLSGFRAFQAMGITGDHSKDPINNCPGDYYPGSMFTGVLTGSLIGRGSYQLCTYYDSTHFAYPFDSNYLTFTNDADGSIFKFSIRVLSSDLTLSGITLSGTYSLDPTASTGGFAQQFLDASGTFVLNTHAYHNTRGVLVINTGTLVLNGVLVINSAAGTSPGQAPPSTPFQQNLKRE